MSRDNRTPLKLMGLVDEVLDGPFERLCNEMLAEVEERLESEIDAGASALEVNEAEMGVLQWKYGSGPILDEIGAREVCTYWGVQLHLLGGTTPGSTELRAR